MSTRLNASAAALWASAFLIAALVIVQAGRLPGGVAHAEMTSSSTDYRLMTTDSGLGGDAKPNELLYVIDNRAEVLLCYQIENAQQRRILLRASESLPAIFNRVR